MPQKHFNLLKTDGDARYGELNTSHRRVSTPVFMPVGSQASVKTLTPDDIRELGFDMVLANTYHLYLRPGVDIIEQLGGLHQFMAWNGAILTDSGGYQVFSLAPLRRITDDGVTFRSHIDGSEHFLTPQLAISYQESLGADIIMVLDECPAYDDSEAKIKQSLKRTHSWAKRCQEAHRKENQALYAIVQGGIYPALRRESADTLVGMEFPGYGIGGLSIGEPKEVTLAMVEETTSRLPNDKPRYLMGVGSPEDIIEGVARGVDMFDSALPTRVARNGALFTWQGRINIRNASYTRRDTPIDPECNCYACHNFSAAYLNHLFRSGELLALRLATLHNLTFINTLVQKIRTAIDDNSFVAFRKDFLDTYRTTNEQTRFEQKQKWLKDRKH